MSQYQSTNTLVTSTDAPLSGTGTATPEGAASNANYGGWSWEVVLATVLGIGAPDRGEITGQPWLTVQANGQGAAGSHLIWSAGWDTNKDGSGASSISVFINPALYTDGGAWDSYLTTPATALAGVPTQDYDGLALSPPTFQSASVAVTGVETFLAAAVQQLGNLHTQAASGPAAEFQGDVATVVSELLGDLRKALSNVHDQMTTPEDYGASISAAGDAAGQFLTDLMSAYLAWTQVPGHSPLGAVVQVLEGIATPDANGAYVISDPQNTPFGDLTTPDAWPAVEQAAKNLWTSLLAGESPAFAGLDPQGRVALGKLTAQFAATSDAVIPVIGPGMSTRQQNPDGPVTGQGGTGAPPNGQPAVTNGPNAAGGPAANGPAANGPAANGPQVDVAAGPAPGPGPGAGPAVVGGPSGGPAPAGAPLVPVALLATGPATTTGATTTGTTAAGPTAADPGGAGPDAGVTDLAVPPGTPGAGGPDAIPGQVPDLAAVPGAGPVVGTASVGAEDAAAGDSADTADLADGLPQPSALAGAIGATADDRADTASHQPHRDGFTGTIGQPPEAGRKDGAPLSHGGQHDGGRKKALPPAPRQAPTAGFSLGRDPSGSVLSQAAVPTVTARPTAVLSSPVNSQLVPGAGALNSPATGGTAAALPSGAGSVGGTTPALPPGGPVAGGPAAGGPAGQAAGAGSAAPAEQVMLGPGASGAGGATGEGEPGGMVGSPMMPSGGRPGGGSAGQERMRRAYLPEEEEAWGAGPGPTGVGLGADDDAEFEFEFEPGPSAAVGTGEHTEDGEDEFVAMPSAAVGIGARPDPGPAAEEVQDWRMR